jgi:glycosyltransferase involved in cell wall biosynthesis
MTVSIVIPTWRRPQLLERLLRSIQLQTHRDYEVIVVDDCSPDESAYRRLVEEYSTRLPALTFLRNEGNRGAPHSRNRGIRQARYDLVALVDDDDEWLPEKLSRQVELFSQTSSQVALTYTWTDVVADGKRSSLYRADVEGRCLSSMLRECFVPSPSVMVRKAALLEAGLFDERLPSCQDWDMWTRILALGYEARVVREVLTLYHRQASDSIGTSPRARRGYVMYYRKHFWKLLRFGQWRHLARLLRMSVNI